MNVIQQHAEQFRSELVERATKTADALAAGSNFIRLHADELASLGFGYYGFSLLGSVDLLELGGEKVAAIVVFVYGDDEKQQAQVDAWNEKFGGGFEQEPAEVVGRIWHSKTFTTYRLDDVEMEYAIPVRVSLQTTKA